VLLLCFLQPAPTEKDVTAETNDTVAEINDAVVETTDAVAETNNVVSDTNTPVLVTNDVNVDTDDGLAVSAEIVDKLELGRSDSTETDLNARVSTCDSADESVAMATVNNDVITSQSVDSISIELVNKLVSDVCTSTTSYCHIESDLVENTEIVCNISVSTGVPHSTVTDPTQFDTGLQANGLSTGVPHSAVTDPTQFDAGLQANGVAARADVSQYLTVENNMLVVDNVNADAAVGLDNRLVMPNEVPAAAAANDDVQDAQVLPPVGADVPPQQPHQPLAFLAGPQAPGLGDMHQAMMQAAGPIGFQPYRRPDVFAFRVSVVIYVSLQTVDVYKLARWNATMVSCSAG